MPRLEGISRTVRQRFYYAIPDAGRMIGLGRSQSYKAVEDGLIPVKRLGKKFLLVPRKPWDRTVKRLLGTVTKTQGEGAAKKAAEKAAEAAA